MLLLAACLPYHPRSLRASRQGCAASESHFSNRNIQKTKTFLLRPQCCTFCCLCHNFPGMSRLESNELHSLRCGSCCNGCSCIDCLCQNRCRSHLYFCLHLAFRDLSFQGRQDLTSPHLHFACQGTLL